jgi:hypothetical protein
MQQIAELVDANDRRSRASRWRVHADKYRLAQAHKLIRLYELGQLPLELMREMEKLARNAPKSGG